VIKHFLKIFLSSIVLFVVLMSVTVLGYILFVDKDIVVGIVKGINVDISSDNNDLLSSTYDYNTAFGRIVKKSKRINVLVVGLESLRTDTIMVASYDSEEKIADLISIPRDTYYPRDNDRPDSKKINAVYAQEGIEGLTNAVQEILGIPIEKHVIFDYAGVVSCIDIIGGVEVNVPFHMQYSDPYDDPPLNIDIPEGLQILDGEKSLKFLRFRKGYANQDLGRIEAQQQFIKSAAKKVLSIKLPAVIKEAYSNVQTNFSLNELLSLAGKVIGFSTDNISLQVLPGEETPLEGLSFYIPNVDGIKKIAYDMYGMNNGEENQENQGTSENN
jgi:polyisoprenyl-teichoic acid--peptidoglycan teichoic acid transferase